MTLQLSDGVIASGEAHELGIFLASYQANAYLFMNSIKAQKAKTDLVEKLAREFKSVKVTPIKKEDGEQNAGKG